VTDRRFVTYGFNPQADLRAENLELSTMGSFFDVVFTNPEGEEKKWERLFLPMAGRHNVQNALSAIVVSRELGLSESEVRSGLQSFTGVERRFTFLGNFGGASVIDDYGHHPVEISAVLQAARQVSKGKVHAVMQPHRFSRLKELFNDFSTCFNEADFVYISEVYPAGEKPIENINSLSLVDSILAHGHKHAVCITKDNLPENLKINVNEGDIIVCLGAGDITYWASDLVDKGAS
jgi:UDP-N-acetylmuramate--alanine ligase